MNYFRPEEAQLLQTCLGGLVIIALIVALMVVWARRGGAK